MVHFRKWLYLIIALIACGFQSLAQQDIGISVHVNRLPQGAYPTKLYQFSATPGLVLVTITNYTNTAHAIYLTGTVTGDNGVTVTTAKGYQPATINLKPLEIKTLNAIEAGNLFDPNSLVYQSGSNNIKPSVFGEQGLPEGTYQICVRAFDAATHKPVSEEDPIGCSNVFSVSTLEPPVILSPADEDSIAYTDVQNIAMRWTTPPGAPPTTQYTLRIVEILGNRSANDAMLSNPTPFFETTVQGAPMFLYSMQYPQLVQGRSYAMRITAIDPSGNSTFRNQGRSEVVGFTYGVNATAIMYTTMSKGGMCQCKNPVNDSRPQNNLSGIQPGTKLNIDGFDLTVTSIISSSGGKLSGEGKIQVPILKFIPVNVTFKDIQVNAANQVIIGNAVAKQRSDAASLLPSYDPSQPNLVIDPNNAGNFSQYISNYMANSLDPQQALGYSLPIGINNVSAAQVTIAVTSITFAPDQAYFDCGASFDVPEASMTVALGGRGICFAKDKALCGQGVLFLEKDFALGSTGIAIKGVDGPDPGTYIEFGTDGFKDMHIRGEYTFPAGLLEKIGGGQVKAQLTVDAASSWADWIASVSIDPFRITGSDDFNFMPGSAFYDHSDKKNPGGMPSFYEEGAQPTWRGFLIPSLQVKLPALIRNFAGKDRLTASATNFIIDNQGLSGTLGIDNLFTIDQGSLDTWQYSIDRIEAVFKKNSFVQGDMRGKVLLPIANGSDPNSQLDYTCTLSSSNGLNFQFVIKPKDDLDIQMWVVNMNVKSSSSLSVTVGSSGFKATAVLTGDMSFKTEVPGLGKVNLTALSFQNLTLNTSEPYISDGSFVMGQSSPAKSIAGLSVSLPESPKLTPNKLGISVVMDVTLADIPAIPTAHAGFSILGGFDIVGGKMKARLPQIQVDEIGLDGWVGPVKVKGKVKFFNDDPKFGDGVEGVLDECTFPPGFTVRASVLFGKKDYNYFFVGASFNLPPPGIPIGGGIVPLSIFGFGGGVYYNMTLNQEPMAAKNINTTDPASMYKLAPGVTGFKGSMTLGTTDGSVFVAMGTLTVEMDQASLAIHKLAVNIDGGMYTSLGDIDAAMVQGHGFIQYDFSQSEFSAGIGMAINLPGGFVKGSGQLGILTNFNTGEWYFKIGDAAPGGNKVDLTLSALGIINFDFKTYQNVGNRLQLPASLQSIYDAVSGRIVKTDTYTNPQTKQTETIQKLAGVMIGASTSASLDLEFLVFYMKFKAELGFDLALITNASQCDNGDKPGMNGYYALGDLYAGGSFEFGLMIDIWFYTGKVSVAEIGFKATLDAGFPNPFVLDGWLEANYSLFDGLVSGNMHFHAKYSSAGDAGCKLVVNPFGGMPLVSAIYPGDNDENISIMSNINVAFNFPVNQEFEVTVRDDNTGQDVPKRLLVVVKKLSVNKVGGYTYAGFMNEDGSSTTQGGATIQAIHHNALIFGWENAFDPQSKHMVRLTVYGYQRDENGNWQEVTQARIEDTSISFTTGDCVKRLDEGSSLGKGENGAIAGNAACASYPFPGQRYFLPKQRSQGFIQLVYNIPCMEAAPAIQSKFQIGSVAVTGYNLVAQFISIKDNFESNITQQGKYLYFDIPNLSASTVYQLRIVKRPIYQQTGPSVYDYMSQLGNKNNITTRNESLMNDPENGAMKNFVVVKNYTADATASLKRTDDIEIYNYYFKTSRFQTLGDKIGGATQTGSVSWSLMMPIFQVSMLEGLDTYDANGLAYDGSGNGSNDWIIPPLINLDEKYSDNPWMQNVIAPLVTQYNYIKAFDPEAAFNSLWELNSPSGNTGYTFTIAHSYVRGREPFMVTGFDPPLSSTEIPVVLKPGAGNILVTPKLGTSTTPVTNPMTTTPASSKIKLNP